MKFDVVIAGGGVLGLSTAFHLAGMNRRVLLLEREILPGAHASGRNAGMFRQLYRHEKLTEWAERSRRSWPEAIRSSCFRQTGSIIVGRKAAPHHTHLFSERIVRTHRGRGKKSSAAVFCETDGLLDSPNYINALCRMCRNRGVELRFSEELRAVEYSGSHWSGETASGLVFDAPQLVDASGAWISRVLARSSDRLRIETEAYARHLFIVDGFPDGYMPERNCGFYWDEERGWYLRLWDRTSRLVSICDVVPANPDAFSPRAAIAEQAAELLLDALPDIGPRLSITRAWHCFRTYTADQLPVVGADPQLNGLYWLGAFGGFGMSTSFAAAQDAALQICGKAADIPLDFSPARVQQAVRLQVGAF